MCGGVSGHVHDFNYDELPEIVTPSPSKDGWNKIEARCKIPLLEEVLVIFPEGGFPIIISLDTA